MKILTLFSELPNTRKILLISGMVTLLISTCVIFPIEYNKNTLLEEFVYTFLTLAIALFLLLIGLLGKHFFKGVLFILVSSIIGSVLFFVAYPSSPFAMFIAIWIGIPSGIITALIFMLVNYWFLNKIENYKLMKQIFLYSIILCMVSILFGYGGDWIFEIKEYFKNKT